MLLRADIQITTVIKSLTDVVMPALDPGQKVAIEQVNIIVSQLKFLQEHLPLQSMFDLDELARLLGLSRDLMDLCGETLPDMAAMLEIAIGRGSTTQERGQGAPDQLSDTILELRATCGAATTVLFGAGGATRAAMAKIVMAYSAEQLVRDRAWVVSQGWESNPDELPRIEDLLQPV